MKRTVIISGAAGYGLNTLQFFFENALKSYGYYMMSYKNYMSRIRGGFNFTTITFSDQPVNIVEREADLLVCLDPNGYTILDHLKPGATILTYKAFAKHLESPQEVVVDGALAPDQKIDNKAFPMVALGSLFSYFGFDASYIQTVNMKKWAPEVNQSNQGATEVGFKQMEAHKSSIAATATATAIAPEPLKNLGEKRLMRVNGNQAVALGAMAADLRFFSAYPMAPSTGIMMTLSKFERQHTMAVEQVEDEIAGIIAALGASSNGARAMTATSGGGFSLMVEGLGFAGVAELPIVIANVQRPGPATGLPTRTEQGDLEFISRASQGEFPRLLIAPTSIEDCFYQAQRAFNMADKYQLPVVILTDQFLADSTATVEKFDPTRISVDRHINTDKEGYKRYDYDKILNGRKFPGLDDHLIMNDSHVHDEHGHMTETIENTLKLKNRLMKKLDLMTEDLLEPDYIGTPNAKRVLMGWGSTASALKDAVATLNHQDIEIGALLFTDVFPVPQKKLREVVESGAQLINVEQNYNNQFGKLVRAETGMSYSKTINKYDGRPLTSEDVIEALLALV